MYMEISSLCEFIARYAKLFVLTGAGCSTDSGMVRIPVKMTGWPGGT